MTPTDSAPAGLPDDHFLLAIDYVVDVPWLRGVYDPRWASLTTGGSLLFEGRDVNAILGTTVTKLDAAGLERA